MDLPQLAESAKPIVAMESLLEVNNAMIETPTMATDALQAAWYKSYGPALDNLQSVNQPFPLQLQ